MAEFKNFVVKGEIRQGRETRRFSREISGTSKSYAESKVKSLFGSNYKIKRNNITVSSVEEV